MRQAEKMFLEAVGNLFKNKSSRLGIVPGGEEHTHTAQFHHELVEDMFALKVVESAFHEDLCGAFRDIHSYKYLDDPTFGIAFTKRLTARGIPTKEIQKAMESIESIKKELGKDTYQEKESGWHPDIAEIADMTRNAHNRKPKHLKPFSGGGPAPEANEAK